MEASASLGLIGKNISYSLSPFIHQRAAQLLGREASYQLFDLDEAELKAFLKQFYEAGGQGLNVTTPYKTTIARLLGSPLSAVNTLYRGPHFWQADSTDGPGFDLAMTRLGKPLRSFQKLVILGNGGVVNALLEYLGKDTQSLGPRDVYLFRRDTSRDRSQERLYPKATFHFYDFSPEQLQSCLKTLSGATLLVQASSAPQKGDDLDAFVPALDHLQGSLVDLVYGQRSHLYDAAIARGLSAEDGLPMLVEQARLAQKYWWGEMAAYEDLIADLRSRPH